MIRYFRRAALVAALGLWGFASITPAYSQPMYAAPSAYNARRPADQPLEARIHEAWMINPMTANPTLHVVMKRGIIEVHGEVPNEQARQMALAVARDSCHLPVTDHLKIRPFTVRGSVQASEMGYPGERVVQAGATYPQPARPNTGPTYVVTQYHQAPPTPAPHIPAVQNAASPQQMYVAAQYPHPQNPGYPTRVASPQVAQQVDLLSPPLPTQPGLAQAEEMQLMQVPVVQGAPVTQMATRPGTVVGQVYGQSRSNVPGRPSQFAVTSRHVQAQPTSGVILPPTPTTRRGAPSFGMSPPVEQQLPLATLETAPQPARPIAITQAAKPVVPAPPQEVAASVGGAETQEPRERQEFEVGPRTAITLEPETLKQKVQEICGKAARDVTVSMGPNQTYSVKILMENVAAEEEITPKLLAMPELSSGQIRLEIHVPQ